jgi:hypothetical protein
MHRTIWACLLGIGVALTIRPAGAQMAPPRIMAEAIYFQEKEDRAWRLRFTGEVASRAGILFVLHDARGREIRQGIIPFGVHSAEKPFEVAVAVDGITGDYRMVMVGDQTDFLMLETPFCDLPFEVYGGSQFALATNRTLYFLTSKDEKRMALGAYGGHLKVYDEAGAIVADTEKGGTRGVDKAFNRFDNVIDFEVSPSTKYRIEASVTYVHSRNRLCVAFSKEKLFVPDAALDDVKWWELAKW